MLVRIGRVLKAHGTRGFAKCAYTTEYPGSISDREVYYLVDPVSGETVEVHLDEAQLKPDYFFAKFRGLDAPEPLKKFHGWDIVYTARRGQLPRDEADDVYICELLGLEVRSIDGTLLGTVVNVIETGAHVVLEIEGINQLVPYTDQFTESLDLDKGELVTSYPIDRQDKR